MKRFIVMVTLLAQVLVTGTALAIPLVTLDFSGINASQDVTVPNSLLLNRVTLSYDDLGSGTDSATVDSAGIFGTTAGTLIFDFAIPATALNLGFSLLDSFSADPQIPDALTVMFFGNGNLINFASLAADFFAYDSTTDPTFGLARGLFAYNGSAFDHAELLFSTGAPFFTVDNVSYEPVPEPGTILLLSAGLFGLAVYGRRRMES